MNKYVIYIHRSSDRSIFYVGLGSNKYRAYSRAGRTKGWISIADKGYSVEIIYYNLTKWDAYKIERFLILKYGKISDGSGILVNIK